LSKSKPQLMPVHTETVVHPQPFGPAPPPPQTSAPVHLFGQVTVRPQLLVAEPHDLPAHVVAIDSGTHVHTLGAPEQALPDGHAVHRAGS